MAPLTETNRLIIIWSLLGISVFLVYFFHAVLSIGTVFSHFFYIPIILSALWWGRKSILVALFLGGLLIASHLFVRTDVLTLNDYGRAIMFVVVAFVVSSLSLQLKRQQRDTETERDRAQGYLDVAAVLLVVINADQTVALINRRGCELLGYREDEIVGKNWFDLAIPEHARKKARQAFERVVSGRSAISGVDENVIVTESGDERVLIWKDAVLRDPGGRVTGILGSGKDITDRIRAEEALRRSEAQLRTVVESLNEGLIVADLDGNLIHWNRAALAMHELSDIGEVRRKVNEFAAHFEISAMDGTVIPVEEWPLSRILQGEHLQDEEALIRRIGTDWQRVFNYGGTLVRDTNGNPLMAVITISDITERKQAEESIQAANEEANLYLDIMVHDINNANAVALGYSEVLGDDLCGRDREMAQKIRSSVRQSIAIIQNVSTIRQLRSPDPVLKPVDLDAVIQAEVRQHPEASIIYCGRPVYVVADDLLPQVFTNLIGNSIKFGEPDVEVRVTVTESDEDVEVSVEDTGPGLPDPVKPTLFARFQKGKSRRSGKGLGLYIVRMLVERYGGSIRAEDRVPDHPEQGAAFRLTLRKAQKCEGQPSKERSVSPGA